MAKSVLAKEKVKKVVQEYNEVENKLDVLIKAYEFTTVTKSDPDFYELEDPTYNLYKKWNYKILDGIKDAIVLEEGEGIPSLDNRYDIVYLEDDYYMDHGEMRGLSPVYLEEDQKAYVIATVLGHYSKTPNAYEDLEAAYPTYEDFPYAGGLGFFGNADRDELLSFWRSVYTYDYFSSLGCGVHFVRKSYLNLIAPDESPEIWYMGGNAFPHFDTLEDSPYPFGEDIKANYWGSVLPSPQEAAYTIDRLATPYPQTDILSRRTWANLGYPASDYYGDFYYGRRWTYTNPFAFHIHSLKFHELNGNIYPYVDGPGTPIVPAEIPLPLFYPPLVRMPAFVLGLAKKIEDSWLSCIVDGSWEIGDSRRKII